MNPLAGSRTRNIPTYEWIQTMMISKDHPIVEIPGGRRPRGLFIMDLDGTLLRSDRQFSSVDLDALGQLGELGIIRAIATGRSLYSFDTVDVGDLPVDFVIFSMGAGVRQNVRGKVIRKIRLEPHEVKRACKILIANQLDFMIHRTIPDNHMFSYFRSNAGNDDFERRLALYNQFAVPLNEETDGFGAATQLLAVVPEKNSHAALARVRGDLSDFSVIRTTSPLDGKATWIEIFPTVVSKSRTAAWLAEELKINRRNIVSVGNDYNDLDLLEWTANSFVVDNAPEELKNRFTAVASNNDGGVAEAVRRSMESTFVTADNL
jgi:HAD superfamily hydrolase (TIGR01484 family)